MKNGYTRKNKKWKSQWRARFETPLNGWIWQNETADSAYEISGFPLLGSIACGLGARGGQASDTPMKKEGATVLTSLKKMIGMPVVYQDRQLGYVERAVPNTAARKLHGVVIRRGIGNAKWAPPDAIALVGGSCVLLNRKPEHMPDGKESLLSLAYLTTGECVGEVTDAVVAGGTLGLVALEVSGGPLYRLAGRRAYACEYRVRGMEGKPGEVVVPKLMSWAELERLLGEEDEG